MRIGYGISVAGSNQRNLVSAQAEQVIWKVAIFGAGTTSSNGEYVWDGSEVDANGFKIYRKTSNPSSSLTWEVGGGPQGLGVWSLFDVDFDETTYQTESFTFSGIWILSGGGASPAPSSALSYAQDSFISSLTLIGADPSSSNGTYEGNDGVEWYEPNLGNYIYTTGGVQYLYDDASQEDMFFASSFPMIWELYGVTSLVPPTVSNIIYSA